VIRAGHPICTVLSSAATRSLCEAALRTEAAWIRGACAPVGRLRAGEDTEDDE
jgi:hypothetical protein